MSLQNGLGNEEVLEEALGKGKVLGGKTYVGGTLLAPGKVKIGVKGKKTLIGEFDGTVSERAHTICALFEKSGTDDRGDQRYTRFDLAETPGQCGYRSHLRYYQADLWSAYAGSCCTRMCRCCRMGSCYGR